MQAVAEYKRKLNLSGPEAFARRAALSGGRPPPQVAPCALRLHAAPALRCRCAL